MLQLKVTGKSALALGISKSLWVWGWVLAEALTFWLMLCTVPTYLVRWLWSCRKDVPDGGKQGTRAPFGFDERDSGASLAGMFLACQQSLTGPLEFYLRSHIDRLIPEIKRTTEVNISENQDKAIKSKQPTKQTRRTASEKFADSVVTVTTDRVHEQRLPEQTPILRTGLS